MKDSQSAFVSKDDFPIKVTHASFTRYSHFPTNVDKSSRHQTLPADQKNVIIGGYDVGKGFHELIIDDETHSINYKSFEKDYKNNFANLAYASVDIDHAQFTDSYLVQNNRYLVVFYLNYYYNVYDMENDKWLLKPDEKHLEMNHVQGTSQSVLINDEIIILSCYKDINFYFIGGDFITNPILLRSYKLKTNEITLHGHGMCVIDFKKIKDGNAKAKAKSKAKTEAKAANINELNQTYKIKIVVFAGDNNNSSTFVYLDILLSYNGINVANLSITETIKLRNTATDMDDNNDNDVDDHDTLAKKWEFFGFLNVLNCKQEPIVITVGGWKTKRGIELKRSIHLFNCVTKELIFHQNVCLPCIARTFSNICIARLSHLFFVYVIINIETNFFNIPSFSVSVRVQYFCLYVAICNIIVNKCNVLCV